MKPENIIVNELIYSFRLYNCLRTIPGVNIDTLTLKELTDMWMRHEDKNDDFSFYKFRNFGKKSLEELKDIVYNPDVEWYEDLMRTKKKQEDAIFKARLDKIKASVKSIHKLMFYEDTINMETLKVKATELNKLLNNP
jgi:hypothetical protein